MLIYGAATDVRFGFVVRDGERIVAAGVIGVAF